MKSLSIHMPGGSGYQVICGPGLRKDLSNHLSLSGYSSIFLFTEQVIEEYWMNGLDPSLQDASRFLIPSGELSKSVSVAQSMWEFLLEERADRKSLVVNIGGGMVTDLGGFVASTYMRGVDFVNVPTTLLSQVDASIGGKTGINLKETKNIVGTFTQPQLVLLDTDFLQTLPKRELRSGMAEVLKHGLIRDSSYFESAVAAWEDDHIAPAELTELIFRSCEIKRDVVTEDERESGVRKILNFGHTFGHAFEALSHAENAPLLHGEAISLGMLAESQLSQQLQLITEGSLRNIRDALEKVGLPTQLQTPYPFEKVYKLIERDKKNSGGSVSWTLLSAIGCAQFDRTLSKETVRSCYESLF